MDAKEIVQLRTITGRYHSSTQLNTPFLALEYLIWVKKYINLKLGKILLYILNSNVITYLIKIVPKYVTGYWFNIILINLLLVNLSQE